MSWADWHKHSDTFASEASRALRSGNIDEAVRLYAEAAESEQRAYNDLDPSKTRTLGITAISLLSLWFKAKEYDQVEYRAYFMLAQKVLPDFAANDIRLILQAVWNERSRDRAGVSFLPGEVFVSVKGGQVISGGAPLDLIVDKVQTIQSLFYRTVEFVKGMTHRVHGGPIREIQEACRPWLLQAPPGSYQFSVAIQEPAQRDFFKDSIEPERVAWHFLEILKATTDDEPQRLQAIVPNPQYQSTFLKLSRNLAPTGRTFERMEIRAAGDTTAVLLVPESRTTINKSLRALAKPPAVAPEQEVTIAGTLRAVHLDRDWLDITVDGKSVHVDGVKETVDDLVGPMVNKPVVVRAVKSGHSKLRFIDIERDE